MITKQLISNRCLHYIACIFVVLNTTNCDENCDVINPTSNEDLKNYSHCTSAGQIDIYVEGNSELPPDYSSITDLSPLNKITKVERRVYLSDMKGLENLKGLHNIISAGKFIIYNLPDFDGMNTVDLKLKSAGVIKLRDSLEYNDEPKIKSLTFLKNLETITSSAYFQLSKNVTDINELESLVSAHNLDLDFNVEDLSALTKIKLSGYLGIGNDNLYVCNDTTPFYESSLCTDICSNHWIPFFNAMDFSNINLSPDVSNIPFLMKGCGYSL